MYSWVVYDVYYLILYSVLLLILLFFFFKQKTAYELRISDWSSDVCSSDLVHGRRTWIPGGADSCSVLHESARAFISRVYSICMVRTSWPSWVSNKIGRASCRERVCQYV